MALPKLDVPTYEIVLPVSKKKVKFRPFLVKEQRNLLMALESDDSPTIQQNIRDILINCCLNEDFDVDSLPIIDVEFFFINLRGKSVGEVVESKYRCNNEVDGKECGNIMEKDVDLSKIQVEIDETNNPEIQITDKIVIKMKYPEFGIVRSSLQYNDITDLTFNMIAQCVEYIYDGEQFYYAKETTPEEIMEFIESMNQEQFAKLETFFDKLPKLQEVIEMDCKKCGFHHKIKVEGLESFFG